MTRVVKDGEMVGVLLRNEFSANMMFRIFETTRHRYYCDSSGNIYSMDFRSRNIRKMAVSPSTKRRPNPSVKFWDKRIMVKVVVAKAIFPDIHDITPNDVGHLDGNILNNSVTNIFVRIRRPVVDESVGWERKNGKRIIQD